MNSARIIQTFAFFKIHLSRRECNLTFLKEAQSIKGFLPRFEFCRLEALLNAQKKQIENDRQNETFDRLIEDSNRRKFLRERIENVKEKVEEKSRVLSSKRMTTKQSNLLYEKFRFQNEKKAKMIEEQQKKMELEKEREFLELKREDKKKGFIN